MYRSLVIAIRISTITFINELKAIFTDTGALLIIFGAAVIYPVAYSVAYKNNVLLEIPMAVVDLDKSTTSQAVCEMIDASQKLDLRYNAVSLKEAENLFWENKVNGIVMLPSGFEKEVLSGHQGDVSLYSDASYFLLHKETLSGILSAVGTFSAGIEIRRGMARGGTLEQAMTQRNPVQSQFQTLYNPSGAYGSFVMPGIIIIILQQTLLVGIGMVSGSKREKSKRKILIPGIMLKKGMFSTIFGRGLAYFVASVFTASFTLIWVYNWFDFPMKGSLMHVLVLLIPFLFSTIFLGLAISIVFKRKEHSIMVLIFLSPIILFMSGISWPTSSMPEWIYKVGHLFPSMKMVPAYLRLRTMGATLADIKPELLFLTIQMLVYFILASLCHKYFTRKHAVVFTK